MNVLRKTILVMGIAIAHFSCKVEGDPGPPGRDGLDGNANVKVEFVTVSSSTWTGDGFGFEAQRPCSILTPDILTNGAVLCYMDNGNNGFVPLPYSITTWYPDQNGQPARYTSHTLFAVSPGIINFLLQDDDGMTERPQQSLRFRVVALASSDLLGGIDVRNYAAVAAKLGL